jgi:hypothetical protein
MASNRTFRSGPTLLTTTTTTNILNPPTTTGGVNGGTPNTYLIINVIRLGNITNGNAKAALWVGTTGVNTTATAFAGVPGQASAGALTQGISIPANSSIYIPCRLRLDTTDFVVGGSDTATAITIDFEGEIGLV